MNFEMVLFGLTLVGVAVFHRHTLPIALLGLAAMIVWRVGFTTFDIVEHAAHHAGALLNLFGLIVGFAVLADHFERSGLPDLLPRWLPDDWKGPLALACAVFVLSAFLDNIAAAMIGGSVASRVFKQRVHIGYLATLTAAANAGGAGSVLGDSTTTMMWIAGVEPFSVVPAYLAAIPALLVTGVAGSLQQDRHQRITKDASADASLDYPSLALVGGLLAVLIVTNVAVNTQVPALAERWPFLAVALWVGILAGVPLRAPDWRVAAHASRSSLFLVSLVLAASMVPIDSLPQASVGMAAALGALSAVFDNIPLTAIALRQGGYDYALLAFAVGFGGSMTWFGSSAGVAITSEFPEAKNVGAWVRHGWHVPLAYAAGFVTLVALRGWQPG